jgi:branched-chain amino acid transport system substrate-binding protein
VLRRLTPRTATAMSAVAAACGVLALSACGSSSGGSGGDEGPIKVGGILSLSGAGSVFGQAEERSMRIAVDAINRNGGVDGRKIDLKVEDDRSEPSQALTAARSLIQDDKVSAIFGASSGTMTLAFLPVAKSLGTPVLAPNSTVSVTQEFPDNVFRTTPVDTAIVDAVVNYFRAHDIRRVALLTETAAFGAQAGDAIERAANSGGFEIVDREQYDPASTDLTPELTKIRSSRPDIVVVWGTGAAPSIAFKNMRSLGMSSLPRMAPLGVATESNIKLADGAMDGVIIPGVIDAANPGSDAQRTFVDEFRRSTGHVPTTLDAIAWDPAYLLAEAVRDARSTDPRAITRALDELCDFQGAVGTYCYSRTHDGLGPDAVTFVQIKGTDFASLDGAR